MKWAVGVEAQGSLLSGADPGLVADDVGCLGVGLIYFLEWRV